MDRDEYDYLPVHVLLHFWLNRNSYPKLPHNPLFQNLCRLWQLMLCVTPVTSTSMISVQLWLPLAPVSNCLTTTVSAPACIGFECSQVTCLSGVLAWYLLKKKIQWRIFKHWSSVSLFSFSLFLYIHNVYITSIVQKKWINITIIEYKHFFFFSFTAVFARKLHIATPLCLWNRIVNLLPRIKQHM